MRSRFSLFPIYASSIILSAFLTSPAMSARAATPPAGANFDRVITVIFENTDAGAALRQPFFGRLAAQGANFTTMLAVTHPSQPNYIALTAGATHGVRTNNSYDLDVANIADLLEAKGLTWKVYAEGYPGGCFTGKTNRGYARKHNPFISFVGIQKDPARCANIVDEKQFDLDVAAGALPNYVFYVPDNKNSGHDTGVAYADRFYQAKFEHLVNDANFMKRTVLISTFDENEGLGRNLIYTSIVGPDVLPQSVAKEVSLYSLMRFVEDNWSLGDVGQKDATAPTIPNIWR